MRNVEFIVKKQTYLYPLMKFLDGHEVGRLMIELPPILTLVGEKVENECTCDAECTCGNLLPDGYADGLCERHDFPCFRHMEYEDSDEVFDKQLNDWVKGYKKRRKIEKFLDDFANKKLKK